MYIRLVDKNNWVSVPIHIHSDEKEFLVQVYKWRKELWQWISDNPKAKGMPLGRLDAGTCMFDLIRYLGKYYIENTPDCEGRVWATLKLEDFPKDKNLRGVEIEDQITIMEIKTYEE